MFKIGADVYTTDGRAGKLVKVVTDADGDRGTHLIVEKGFLQRADRIVPCEAVAEATDERIRLNVSAAELEQFPPYRGSHFISEGMRVYDRLDQLVGTVQLVYPGGASDAAVARTIRAHEAAAAAAHALGVGPVSAGGDDDVPPELWARMLRQGYVRIEGWGITGAERYVMPEQIAGVSGNRVRLYASRDELTRLVGQEKSLSLIGRINEGMPVFDRADQFVGTVRLVYYGGASDAAIERASRLTQVAAATVGAHAAAPVTFGGGEIAPELRERMLRQGYLRIEGPGITGARRYVTPEQIARVVGNQVQLCTSRAELITPNP